MKVTNQPSGTNVHEMADGNYRIKTPVAVEGAGGFSLNEWLAAAPRSIPVCGAVAAMGSI